MKPIDKVIFILIPACAEASAGRKAGKPELCLSIMHLCPDIRRRGGFSAWCTSAGAEQNAHLVIEGRILFATNGN